MNSAEHRGGRQAAVDLIRNAVPAALCATFGASTQIAGKRGMGLAVGCFVVALCMYAGAFVRPDRRGLNDRLAGTIVVGAFPLRRDASAR